LKAERSAPDDSSQVSHAWLFARFNRGSFADWCVVINYKKIIKAAPTIHSDLIIGEVLSSFTSYEDAP